MSAATTTQNQTDADLAALLVEEARIKAAPVAGWYIGEPKQGDAEHELQRGSWASIGGELAARKLASETGGHIHLWAGPARSQYEHYSVCRCPEPHAWGEPGEFKVKWAATEDPHPEDGYGQRVDALQLKRRRQLANMLAKAGWASAGVDLEGFEVYRQNGSGKRAGAGRGEPEPLPEDPGVVVPFRPLRMALELTGFAQGDDRGWMLWLKIKAGSKLEAWATDGCMLAYARVPWDGPRLSGYFDAATVARVLKLPKRTIDVKLPENEPEPWPEQNMPRIERLWQEERPSTVEAGAEELARAVGLAMQVVKDARRPRIVIAQREGGGVELRAEESYDGGEATVEIPGADWTGPAVATGYQGLYLMAVARAAKAVGIERVRIRLPRDEDGCLVEPAGWKSKAAWAGVQWKVGIMPVRE